MNTIKNKSGDEIILFSEAIKKDRVFALTHTEYRPNIFERIRYAYFLLQRRRGYSVAAIIGHKEFFGLNFYVNKHVLIPRPDTELMVEEAIKTIKSSDEKTLLIDIGVGSGCVPISIAKNIGKEIKIIASDISCHALYVAKKNATRHGVRIKFLYGSLLSALNRRDLESSTNIIITANLPYLTNEQFQAEPSIWREPKTALVAYNGGLALYEKLLEQTSIVFPNKKITLFFEIDPTQDERIRKIIKHFYPDALIEIKKDLSGLNRLVKIST